MGAENQADRRWSQRRDVELDVDVFIDGSKFGTCQTRDVGLGGVFLRMSETRPRQDVDVDLMFHVGKAPQETKHRLRARVVRETAGGVGFMFKDFDTISFRALQEIMRQAPETVA